jgi:hypothetical protein
LLLVPLALSVALGNSRLLGYTELLVLLTLSAQLASGLLAYTDNNPFYALSTTLIVREGFIGKISFHTLSTASDLLVAWADSANSQSSLFSSFSLRQTPNLENLPQTESTFSPVGRTAGMEWKSCSQDTGPTRSSGKALTADLMTVEALRSWCSAKACALASISLRAGVDAQVNLMSRWMLTTFHQS